ncbi:MAG: WD40 repeat domain-containing protein [Planctomycetota bacterium JB042]
MPRRRALSWLWNGLALAMLGAAVWVHRDAVADVRAHEAAAADAAERVARRSVRAAWARAGAEVVPSAPRWLRAIAPSPPSRSPTEVACGGADGAVRVHDGSTGAPTRTWSDHHGRAITALAWIDGVVVSGDAAGTVVAADAEDGTATWTRSLGREVVAVAARAAPGEVLAVGRDGRRVRWRLVDGELLAERPPSPYPVLAFDPDPSDGAVAWAAAGGNVRAWDAWTDERVGRAQTDATHRVDALAVDAARGLAALARRDGRMEIHDLRGGAPRAAWSEERPVTALAFSPDGLVLFAGGPDGALRLFDARNGRPLGERRAAGDQIAVLRCAPDGRTVYAGGRRGVLHLLRRGAP